MKAGLAGSAFSDAAADAGPPPEWAGARFSGTP